MEFFLIKPVNAMLSTENCYLLNHPPLITYLDCVQHFTSHGVGVFLAHVFLHMYDYFCRAVSYSSESEGSIHIKHFDRTCHVILPKGCTMSHSYRWCIRVFFPPYPYLHWVLSILDCIPSDWHKVASLFILHFPHCLWTWTSFHGLLALWIASIY